MKEEHFAYLLYARKSTEDDERQVQSIEDQVQVMQDFAKLNNLDVVDVLEEAQSAKEPGQRPVFGQLVKRIKAGDANAILTWSIDRLARNPVDGGMVEWLLQSGVVKSIRTPVRKYRPEDNAIIMAVENSMATQYVRDLSKNVKRGMLARAEKGWLPGTAPPGYANTKNGGYGENTILVDPQRFKLIKRAWEHLLTGAYTAPQVLRLLNNEWGYRTPMRRTIGGTPLSMSVFYKLLTNPFYTGVFRFRGKLYQGKHTPMITQEQFDRVQKILGRTDQPRSKNNSYAYTGLLRCGECGGVVTATVKHKQRATGQPIAYTYYFCSAARRRGSTCSQHRYTPVEHINKQVAKTLAAIQILPQFEAWALDWLDKEEATAKLHQEERRKALEAERSKTKSQLQNLTNLRVRDLIDDHEFISTRQKLTDQLTTLDHQLTQLQEAGQEWKATLRNAIRFAAHAPRAFAEGHTDKQRAIVASLGSNPTLCDQKIALQSHPWLHVLQEHYPPLEERFRAVEPTLQGSTEGRKNPLQDLILSWCAVVDNVGKTLRESNLLPKVSADLGYS